MATTWGLGFDGDGTARDFPDPVTLVASASVVNGDSVRVGYAGANKETLFQTTPTISKSLAFYSDVGDHVVGFGADVAVTGGAVSFEGLWIGCVVTLSNSTSFTMARCVSVGTNTALRAIVQSAASTCLIDSCMLIGWSNGAFLTNHASAATTMRHSTVIGSNYCARRISGTATISCCVLASLLGFLGTASGDYNRYTNSTSVPGANSASLYADDPKFMRDNANGKHPLDFRVLPTSYLVSAGVDAGGTEDIDGNAYSGTFPIGCSAGAYFVDPSYVLTTATPPGTFDEAARNTDPGVSNVRIATDYKIQNVELTGTLDPDVGAPSIPTIIAADDETGTSATITISGSDADTTNTVYYRKVTASAWSNGGSRSEDGAKQVTGLTAGAYYFYVASVSLSGSSSASAPVVLLVTNGSDNDVANIADAIVSKLNSTVLPSAYSSRAYYVRKALDQHDTKAAYVLPAEDGFLSSTAGMQARQTDLSFLVVWFYRATTDSAIDGVVKEVLDAEHGMRNHTANGYRCISGTIDTVIDAEMYNETRCYRAQLRLTYRAVE